MKISDPTLKLLLQKAAETKLDQPSLLRDNDSPIAQVATLVLEAAVHSGASDVHIEPRQEYVQVRYRIDGLLREASRLPRNLLLALVARFKVLANIKIDEHAIPQDGRFQLTVDEKPYSLRVSTLPIADGEKMVIRIRDESNKTLTLEQLGYWGQGLQALHNAIMQPYGMVLFTGPTGSGLSTTLGSVLTTLNNPKVNISTLEDPIDFKLPGINQTQVNAKFGVTFASGLRAVLHQDPNIIALSDLRDSETAGLTVQAALGGHLVFAAFRGTSASMALARLRDVGIEPYLTTTALRALVGQRLVRKLCDVCKQSYKPNRDDLARIFAAYGLRTKTQLSMLHKLEQQAAKEGVGKDIKTFAVEGTSIDRLFRPHPDGCDTCLHSGFKGRLGIFETLVMSPMIQKLVLTGVTSAIMQERAIDEGMITLRIDGLVKALRGLTTVDEVLRVTQ